VKRLSVSDSLQVMSNDDASSLFVERTMAATPSQIYDAWVRHLDTWFAAPGSISMHDELAPFWFATEHEGSRHAHYGRFLVLDDPSVIEMTWVTGRNGTDGAETIVRVELSAVETGTALALRHCGFYDEVARDRHLEAWPRVLEQLDNTLQGSN
jgi:uncharacterized protein YndB with AHSA1/START domain